MCQDVAHGRCGVASLVGSLCLLQTGGLGSIPGLPLNLGPIQAVRGPERTGPQRESSDTTEHAAPPPFQAG